MQEVYFGYAMRKGKVITIEKKNKHPATSKVRMRHLEEFTLPKMSFNRITAFAIIQAALSSHKCARKKFSLLLQYVIHIE